MIVNVRGAGGSGKTTLVRSIMDLYIERRPMHVEGRKQPLYYVLEGEGLEPLVVLGHYETVCGGCDTIKTQDAIVDLARERYREGYRVLFEGLLLSIDTKRMQQMHDEGLPLSIVHVDIPMNDCYDATNQRRWARHPDKPPVKYSNIKTKWNTCRRSCGKLAARGVPVYRGDREQSAKHLRYLLNLPGGEPACKEVQG